MPSPQRRLSPAQAAGLVEASALVSSPDSPHSRRGVGLELEMVPLRPHAEVAATLGSVVWPGGSRLTFEPGGQVELSGPCFDDVAAACRAMEADVRAVARAGVPTAAVGMDPDGGRPRVLDAPRYRAMEAFFDLDGPAGRTMMCDTAAFQVNVDCPGDSTGAMRLAYALAPVLAAAFANSPLAGGRPTGWRSNRLRTWLCIDPTRAAPVRGSWVDYALAARVMLIRVSEDHYVAGDGRLTLADWVEHGHPLGWPTEDDVAYHLTTLFPPVRPRRFLEMRFLDALPSPVWQVAAHAVCRLLDGADGSAAAEEACTATADLWVEAARHGVSHPVLRAAALRCLAAVPEAEEFADRYTARGRCPADDVVEVVPL